MSDYINIIETPVPGLDTYKEHAYRVEAYLPANYEVVASNSLDTVRIVGMDRMGWTAEDYVIPRLSSGLIPASLVASIPVTEALHEMVTATTPVDLQDAT